MKNSKAFKMITLDRTILSLIYIATVAMMLAGCGKHSGAGAGDDVALSTIESLPKASGPVIDTAAAVRGIGAGIQSVAATGQSLAHFGDEAWVEGDSPVFCESGNMVRELMRSAVQADKILCYVGAIEKAQKMSPRRDGSYNKYLIRTADGEDSIRVKFRIDQQGNAIKAFEMFTCQDENAIEGTSREYLHQEFLGSHVTMISASDQERVGESSSHRTTLVGKINGRGQWITKEVALNGTYSSDERADSQYHMELVQNVDSFELSAHNRWVYDGNENVMQMAAKLEGLNMGSLPLIALGDGTGKVQYTFGDNGQNPLLLESFNGDDRSALLEAADGLFYQDVVALELPEVGEEETALRPSEIWNCEGEELEEIVFSTSEELQEVIQSCEDTFDFNGGSYISCQGTYPSQQ